jgi:hypothetical protein
LSCLKDLKAMGFENEADNVAALSASKGNLEQAINILIEKNSSPPINQQPRPLKPPSDDFFGLFETSETQQQARTEPISNSDPFSDFMASPPTPTNPPSVAPPASTQQWATPVSHSPYSNQANGPQQSIQLQNHQYQQQQQQQQQQQSQQMNKEAIMSLYSQRPQYQQQMGVSPYSVGPSHSQMQNTRNNNYAMQTGPSLAQYNTPSNQVPRAAMTNVQQPVREGQADWNVSKKADDFESLI